MIISKRHKENLSGVDRTLDYDLKDAISLIKSLGAVKFDESVDLAVNLGVDPKHADQLVRGTVSLPNGTGKDIKVIVLTKDEDKIKEAAMQCPLETIKYEESWLFWWIEPDLGNKILS